MAGHRSFKDLEEELHERPGAAKRIAAHRELAEREAEEHAYPLEEIRQQCGKSASEVADAMGIDEAEVLAIERAHDVPLSTVRRYVEALGAALEVIARFDGDGQSARSDRVLLASGDPDRTRAES
jgi:ribosome-binding protein aMBF1 (putative translation factor)